MTKTENILQSLKKTYKIRTNKELANLFGVDQSTISQWKKRDSLNDTVVSIAFPDFDLEKLTQFDTGNLKSTENPQITSNAILVDVDFKIPYIVAYAGVPAPILDTEENFFNFNKLVKKDEFMLKIIGNSMEQRDIHDGDFIVFNRLKEAKNGDVVCARIIDTITVKVYCVNGTEYLLEPRTSGGDIPKIPINDNVEILGVAKTIMSFKAV